VAVRRPQERWSRVSPRPATGDGLPLVGPSDRSERIVYATGHYRNGILLAPVTASAIEELVIEGDLPEVARPFRLGRFAEAQADPSLAVGAET
jgi:glycine oxidase